MYVMWRKLVDTKKMARPGQDIQPLKTVLLKLPDLFLIILLIIHIITFLVKLYAQAVQLLK